MRKAKASIVTTRRVYLKRLRYFQALLRNEQVDFHFYLVPAGLVANKVAERAYWKEHVIEFRDKG